MRRVSPPGQPRLNAAPLGARLPRPHVDSLHGSDRADAGESQDVEAADAHDLDVAVKQGGEGLKSLRVGPEQAVAGADGMTSLGAFLGARAAPTCCWRARLASLTPQ